MVNAMVLEVDECGFNFPSIELSGKLLKGTLSQVQSCIRLSAKLYKLAPRCIKLENP